MLNQGLGELGSYFPHILLNEKSKRCSHITCQVISKSLASGFVY